MRPLSICAASDDLISAEDAGAEDRTVAAMLIDSLPRNFPVSAGIDAHRETISFLQTMFSQSPAFAYCTTRCVNGATYAIRNTRTPTRQANAMLWKKT